MRKILNNASIVTLIAIIGIMIGMLSQWYLLYNKINNANQKLDMLLDQEGDVVCKVSIMDGYYYYVCDEVITKMPSL